MDSEKLVHLDPKAVMADENAIRYAISKGEISALMASITEMGGVQQPVEVEKLDKPVNGHSYRLTTGFRRHAAVSMLNKEGATLTLPAIVRPISDDLTRLRHQVAENVDRKNLSPMDEAAAIKALVDAGMPKVEIRNIFKIPGGKKGELVPASNAWLNMRLSFLDLPKEMRDKIHAGIVGVKAAYTLTRVAPEKRAEILERAEAAAAADREAEEREEAKYLAQEAKVKETEEAVTKATTAIDHAKAEVELAQAAFDAKAEEAASAFKAAAKVKGKDEKKAAQEKVKALQVDAKGLERKLNEATKELAKAEAAKESNEKKAADLKERLAAARQAKKREGTAGKAAKKAGGVSSEAVQKAAKAAGVDAGVVPLKASEMRKVVKDLTLDSMPTKIQAIGRALVSCFDSSLTPGEMVQSLCKVTGETVAKRGKK